MNLADLFSQVCHQALDRTWAPGGEGLPFCQRCTGLYLGACCASLLGWLRPARPDPWRIPLSVLCLLPMVPLGLHWIPHGPIARTLSGWFFALGLVECLLLLPKPDHDHATSSLRNRVLLYATLGVLGPTGLLASLAWGGETTAHILAALGALGLVSLLVLAMWNLVRLVPFLFRWKQATPRPASA